MANEKVDVLVIGAGVIGLSCARALLEAGRSVRVIDRTSIGAGASPGNCGLVTPSHALPLNRPGMVRQVLGWLGKADAPVYVPLRLDLSFLLWGLSFARNCNAAAMERAIRGRRTILEASRVEFDALVENGELDGSQWEARGLLGAFVTEEAAAKAEASHQLLRDHGLPCESLTRDEVLEREPALVDGVVGGEFYPDDAHLRPEALLSALTSAIRSRGGAIEEGVQVQGFRTSGGRIVGVETSLGDRDGDAVLLATGSWAPSLGAQLGAKLPVQPGRGYSVTAPSPPGGPTVPLLLHEANMAVTPWRNELRLGGTMELSGFDRDPSPARFRSLWDGASRYLRALPPQDGARKWTGFRPMTPDELPVLDRSPKYPNAWFAAGHGMMGVSMAPATGRLMSELIAGQSPHVDPAPYALSRFA